MTSNLYLVPSKLISYSNQSIPGAPIRANIYESERDDQDGIKPKFRKLVMRRSQNVVEHECHTNIIQSLLAILQSKQNDRT